MLGNPPNILTKLCQILEETGQVAKTDHKVHKGKRNLNNNIIIINSSTFLNAKCLIYYLQLWNTYNEEKIYKDVGHYLTKVRNNTAMSYNAACD